MTVVAASALALTSCSCHFSFLVLPSTALSSQSKGGGRVHSDRLLLLPLHKSDPATSMMHPAPRHIHPSITPHRGSDYLRIHKQSFLSVNQSRQFFNFLFSFLSSFGVSHVVLEALRLFAAAPRWLEEEGTCRGAMLQKDCKPLKMPLV